MLHGARQLGDAFAGPCAGTHDLVVREREPGRERTDTLGPLGLGKLVTFRERRKEGAGGGGEQLADLKVVWRRVATNVEQPDDPAQRGAGLQVLLEPGAPAATVRLARARIAIPGKVDEVEPAVERVDVEQPGLAGGGRDVCEATAPDEGVDQARLSDIGAADKGDFGTRRIEREIGIGVASDEANETAQASFFCLGVWVTRRGGRPSVTVSRVSTTS